MKHLFWIICGVIILALLVTWIWVVPADDALFALIDVDPDSRAHA